MRAFQHKSAPKRTVAPTLMPVTLEEAKSELDILDDTSQDLKIIRKVMEAADQVERDSRRVLMTQTWQLFMDEFPCGPIELRKVPVQSVTFIKYYDGGTLNTLSSSVYQTDLVSEPCRILPIYGEIWPSVDCDKLNAVQVEFVAGYTAQASVPHVAKAAVLYALRRSYYGCGDLGDNYWALIEKLQTFGFHR